MISLFVLLMFFLYYNKKNKNPDTVPAAGILIHLSLSIVFQYATVSATTGAKQTLIAFAKSHPDLPDAMLCPPCLTKMV